MTFNYPAQQRQWWLAKKTEAYVLPDVPLLIYQSTTLILLKFISSKK